MPSRHTRRLAVGLAVATLVVSLVQAFAVSPSASAAPLTAEQLQAEAANVHVPLQHRIAAQLQLAPGGQQISANEIAWNGGQVIMSFPLDGQRQAPKSSPAAVQLMAAASPQGAASKPGGGVTPMDIEGCPTVIFGNDWYCFYADINWGGRRLQWSDPYPLSQWVHFSDYGFVNQTSSWVNGGGMNIVALQQNGCGLGCELSLWLEAPHSKSSYVGNQYNDTADGFYTR
jgi:hypothetical protein